MKEDEEMFLEAEVILRYLIADDDKLDTLVMCKSSEIDLITSDHDLYAALGSIKPYDDFKLNKLVKLLEVTTVISKEEDLEEKKGILTEGVVGELRKRALKKSVKR